jgi:PhnB protein
VWGSSAAFEASTRLPIHNDNRPTPVNFLQYGRDRSPHDILCNTNRFAQEIFKMAKSKSHMPAGFHTVTPYIVVPGIARLIDFVEQAFGAQRREVMKREDGSIAHASVTLGDSILEMGESVDKKTMPMTLHVYIPNVDEIYKRALAAGAKSLSEPTDQFYGERSAGLIDDWGNHWYIATYTEDLTPEELSARAAAQGESSH